MARKGISVFTLGATTPLTTSKANRKSEPTDSFLPRIHPPPHPGDIMQVPPVHSGIKSKEESIRISKTG
jgi:hypothetical protein